MKTLPLLLLGAGAVYFIAKKPAKTSTKTLDEKDEKVNTPETEVILKRQGYQIKNCELTIVSKQDAFDYAFKYGSTFGNKFESVKKELFDDCLDTIGSTKKLVNNHHDKAIFIFNMFKNAYSGLASKNGAYEEFKEELFKIRDSIFDITGYLIPDQDVKIIKVI